MTLGADTPGGIRRMTETTGDERAALEGMLRAYPVDQLVEEVLVAWQELADRNEDLVTSKQRLRVLELDLAERKDEVAPEVAQLKAAEIANEGITLEYDSGSTRSTLELIQSRSLLLDARIDFARSERDYIISQFELAKQLGSLSIKSIK